MAEPRTPTRRRPRRSTAVSRKLEAARQRNAEQTAEARRLDQQAEDALEQYFLAEDAITAAEDEYGRKIQPYELAIAKARRQADQKLAAAVAAQELAALRIHEANRTIENVAELLQVSLKAARRMIASARGDAVGEPGGDGQGDVEQDGAEQDHVDHASSPTSTALRAADDVSGSDIDRFPTGDVTPQHTGVIEVQSDTAADGGSQGE